ncbi:MAG: fibronectin type III domain-containing protein [Acidobacteriota bacterium]|jgi:hypothetical protein|nr:fibronectin type III domain-containing protein [Acidobacteriota bacterium]NLT32989.1 fibronectin type III domain-containing protein [Acidobacteriota bacterium]
MTTRRSGPSIRTGKAAAAALLALAFIACARIADPQPPLLRLPTPPTDLSAHQAGMEVVLEITPPERNSDGSSAVTTARAEVFRIIETGPLPHPLPGRDFLDQAGRVLSLPRKQFAEVAAGEPLVLRDPIAAAPGGYPPLRYAVAFVDGRGRAAGLSNQVRIEPVPVPVQPSGLSAEVTESAILLRWEPPLENMDGSRPPRIAGYLVYRSEDPERFPAVPLGTAPQEGTLFADREFEFDRTYHYVVRALARPGEPVALGAPSPAATVTTRDLFPPLPPENLSAIHEGDDIVLFWTPSPSPDVAGYRVLRRTGEEAFAPVIGELVRVPTYRDPGAAGGRYEYAVEAVDAHSNASPATRAVGITPQVPSADDIW